MLLRLLTDKPPENKHGTYRKGRAKANVPGRRHTILLAAAGHTRTKYHKRRTFATIYGHHIQHE